MTVQFISVVHADTLQDLAKANNVSDGISVGMCAMVKDDRRHWQCTYVDDKGSSWVPGRNNVMPPMGGDLPKPYQDDPTFTKTGTTVGAEVIEEPICTLAIDGAIVEIDVRIVSCRLDVLGASYYRRIRKVFQRTLGTVSLLDTIWEAGAGLLGKAELVVSDNKPTLRLTGALLTTAGWTYTVTVCGEGIEMP